MSDALPAAISPKELIQQAEADDSAEMETCVNAINRTMRDKFAEVGPTMRFDDHHLGTNDRVRVKVAQHFRKAGWDVERFTAAGRPMDEPDKYFVFKPK